MKKIALFIVCFITLHAFVALASVQNITQSDQSIADEYAQREYTLENPYIKINPYGKNPLVALVKFETQQPSQITLTIQGIAPAEDITHTFKGFKKEHEIPVYGLYPNHTNNLILTGKTKRGQVQISHHFIQTKFLTDVVHYLPVIKKDVQNHYYYASQNNANVYDEYGYVRFAFGANGFSYWLDNQIVLEKGHEIQVYNLLGKQLHTIPFPDNFSPWEHSVAKGPDGKYLIVGSFQNARAQVGGKSISTRNDIIAEVDSQSDKIRYFDLGKILNPDRFILTESNDIGAPKDRTDWIHTNSVQYDPADDSLLVSAKFYGMFKIDYQTGKLKWLLSRPIQQDISGRDAKGPSLMDKILVPLDKKNQPLSPQIAKGYLFSSEFKYPTKNHDAAIIGNNLYSLFDNGGNFVNPTIKGKLESRAVIYKVDADKKNVQQVWEKWLGEFSGIGSSVSYLPATRSVFVASAAIRDKNYNIFHAKLYRFDYQTGDKLFEAGLFFYKPSKNEWKNYAYKLVPISFYLPEIKGAP